VADSKITITQGTGTDVDTRTIGTEHRQVVVLGDPAVDVGVAQVMSSDPSSNATGVVVREPNSTAIVSGLNSVRVRNVIDGTISTVVRVDRVMNVVDGTVSIGRPDINRVFNVVDGTITVSGITNRIDVQRVHNVVDGTMTVSGITNRIDVQRVFNVVDGTMTVSGAVTANAGSGTMAVYFSPSEPTVKVKDTYATSIVSGTASGSTSAVSASGATIVSPEAGRRIKVYALQLTTTAQVHLTAKFTNGAGTSPTEFWRYALQAPSAGISGANLAVTPPGFIFATGVGETLSLVLDSASLVHYSVAYFKESG
jgi:hypothetical protein